MSELYKIFVCGSHCCLSKEVYSFAEALGETIINSTDFTVILGGYRHGEDNCLSVDYAVSSGAKRALDKNGIDPGQRVITMLPQNDPSGITRFTLGKIIEVKYSYPKSRRFSIVLTSDGVIALEGKSGTREIIDLAWTANKPVLPIPCTGGNALKTWKMYKQDLVQKFGITPEELSLLESSCTNKDQLAQLCIKLLKRCLKPRCFIAMKIGGHPLPGVFETISHVVEAKGYVPIRVDRENFLGSIIENIWNSIRSCDLVLADLTDYNPNVFYEIGIAHTLGKPTILTLYDKFAKVPDNIPFDIMVQRILPYGTRETLELQLNEQIASLKK